MKNFFKITLAIFMCFGLIACNDNKNSLDTNSNNQGTENKLKSDILVHLEINPSFDIHVDNGGVIVGVDCLNNDAKKTYEGLDILYSEYTSGVNQLLKTIYDKGFVKNNSVIKLSIKTNESVAYNIADATSQLINNFRSNILDVSFETNMEIIQNSQQNSNIEQNNNENERPSHVFNEDGSELFYTFYKNGNIETEELRFIDNNNIKVTAITKFDENGTPLSEVTDQEDGVHRERTYINGILSKEYMYIPHDGGHNVTSTFYENGQVAEKIDFHIHTNQEFIFRYDQSGNQTEYIGFDNNDKPVHIKY